MGILWIVLAVVVILALLGWFGRGWWAGRGGGYGPPPP